MKASLVAVTRLAKATDKAKAVLDAEASRLSFYRGEMKYLTKNRLACLGWLADGTAIDARYLASEIASIQENIKVYQSNFNDLYRRMYHLHTDLLNNSRYKKGLK